MTKEVWILDDDPSIREALGIILNESGYATKLFESGIKMTQKLKSHLPGLILVDVILNEENGLDVTQGIKTSSYSQIPIVLMSANKIDPKDLKYSKADGYMKKPFDMYNLVDLIKKVYK